MARSASVDKSRIAAFSVFADLPAPELNELAGAMSEVEVEAGAKVITLDDYGTAIYFIEQGEADVLTAEDRQALGPGDTFGEIALLFRDSGRLASWRARQCGFCPSLVRTSSASGHVYPSSSARCVGSASSVRLDRRTGFL